jgi:hypothetical protein
MGNEGCIKERSPVDEGWTYNEMLSMVIHSSDCCLCLSMCQHYCGDTMDNKQTLVMAHQAQDDVLSHHWKAEVDDLEKRQVETLNKLAALRREISKARGDLANAQRNCVRLMEADNNCVMALLEDGLEEGVCISTSGPSSLLPCRPLSHPRPISQAMEHKIIYISSDSDDDISLIPPPSIPGSSSVADVYAAVMRLG